MKVKDKSETKSTSASASPPYVEGKRKDERDNKPDSHIYLDGKNLKEMRDFSGAYFEESFVHIDINRNDWVFDIMIKNYKDKARLKNFETRFPKCRVTNYNKD